MHSTIQKMSRHVEKLQKEAEEARDLLDAHKRKVMVIPSPDGKILDWSTLKEIAVTF